jgi:hypothetical protein
MRISLYKSFFTYKNADDAAPPRGVTLAAGVHPPVAPVALFFRIGTVKQGLFLQQPFQTNLHQGLSLLKKGKSV